VSLIVSVFDLFIKLFIASGLTWGMLSGTEGYPIKTFFLACIIIAGLFGQKCDRWRDPFTVIHFRASD
jgi:uncharacterized membrane protein